MSAEAQKKTRIAMRELKTQMAELRKELWVTRSTLQIARNRIHELTGNCCEAEKRSMNGGCLNCGDPCL